MENKRQFTRVLFSIDATLQLAEHNFQVNIHDISLNGALVSAPQNPEQFNNMLGTLSFSLADGDANVVMDVAVVHIESQEIGLQCNAIDIESVSHLRRLIELNLGDPEQINKELWQLSRSD
jgi:hypothetical protein